MSRKELGRMKRKVERLEAEVGELSKKIEAQDKKKWIEKIVSLTAELLTIVASIIALVDFFM